MSINNHSSSFPSFFRSTTTAKAADRRSKIMASPPASGNPKLTTCLYQTELGLMALTWSRSLFGRSLHIHLLLDDDDDISLPSLSTPAFHLHIKPFAFWNKQGSKRLTISNTKAKNIQIFWDFSRAKFSSIPEPQSGYYIAVVIDGEMALLVGDFLQQAYQKTRAQNPQKNQTMVLRREHVYGNKLYTTKSSFGGQTRNISIDCRLGEDPKLYFSIDNKRILQIKRLKWKFRGNERVEVDGIHIQISWDVHNWLFEDDEEGYALFMFRFEKKDFEDEDDYFNSMDDNNKMHFWSQQSCGFGFETKKMKKGLLKTARNSSSSSSLSSASSTCSSVMEWASTEENELKGPSGFSLLVYAWKS